MNWRFFLMIIISNLFCSFSLMKAQDLLVTINHDTLNCSVGKIENDFYPVTFFEEEDNKTYNGLIHRDSVLFYKKNYFLSMKDDRLRPWYPLVEVSFDAGVVHQFGKFRIDDDLTDKSDFKAKTGFYLGTDLTYFISKQIGYGIKYNYRSLLGGDVRYQYFGPLMYCRFLEKSSPNYFFFNISGGIGWMAQKNAPVQMLAVRPRIEMSANSFSGDFAVGYSIKMAKHVSLQIKTSCNIGYPNFVRIKDIQKITLPSDAPLAIDGYCHNMNTVNLTAGFIFH